MYIPHNSRWQVILSQQASRALRQTIGASRCRLQTLKFEDIVGRSSSNRPSPWSSGSTSQYWSGSCTLHRNSRRPRVQLELNHCYKSLTNMKSWRDSATARYNRKDSRRPHLPEQLNLPLAIKRRSIGTSLGISKTWLGAEFEISSVWKLSVEVKFHTCLRSINFEHEATIKCLSLDANRGSSDHSYNQIERVLE